jgi:hypothetical protein
VIGWLLAGVLVVLAVTVTAFAWIPAAVVLYWKIGRYYYLAGSKWRRVHFPFMRAYSYAAGVVNGLAQEPGAQFDVTRALFYTLRGQNERASDEELRALIREAVDAGRSFVWRPALAARLRLQNPRLSDFKLESGLDAIAAKFAQADNSLMIRFVILELVRRRYDEQVALDYLEAILNSRAA